MVTETNTLRYGCVKEIRNLATYVISQTRGNGTSDFIELNVALVGPDY